MIAPAAQNGAPAPSRRIAEEIEMSTKTIWRLFLAVIAAVAMAATVSAQDLPGVKTKAELEQLAKGLRSGEITKSQILFKGGDHYVVDTSYWHAKHKPEAQAHAETDEIILVLAGEAQLTLGGKIINEYLKDGSKVELRGTGIKGGTVYKVKPGDVVSVPRGTPHYFEPGEGYIVYMVIKIPGLHA
jgi:quercetin dioxygenase-like cupin family protein